jgi:hypothetical protein
MIRPVREVGVVCEKPQRSLFGAISLTVSLRHVKSGADRAPDPAGVWVECQRTGKASGHLLERPRNSRTQSGVSSNVPKKKKRRKLMMITLLSARSAPGDSAGRSKGREYSEVPVIAELTQNVFLAREHASRTPSSFQQQ